MEKKILNNQPIITYMKETENFFKKLENIKTFLKQSTCTNDLNLIYFNDFKDTMSFYAIIPEYKFLKEFHFEFRTTEKTTISENNINKFIIYILEDINDIKNI